MPHYNRIMGKNFCSDVISRQKGSLAGQYKQMVQNGGELEEVKNSPEDGEGAPLTRSAILPGLRWGELTNTRIPCLPVEEVGDQAQAWSWGLGKGVSS